MIKRGFLGELSLTLENNFMINRFLEAIGAEKYKTYRIYRRRLDGNERSPMVMTLAPGFDRGR